MIYLFKYIGFAVKRPIYRNTLTNYWKILYVKIYHIISKLNLDKITSIMYTLKMKNIRLFYNSLFY